MAFSEKMVHISSEDGYGLAGVLVSPAVAATSIVLWVHGVSLSFSEPEYLAIARALADAGIACLSVETRGQGFGTWLRGPSGSKLGGSAWELLVEAPADLAPWIAFARDTGARSIILAGHGWGASKIVYHLAERGSAGVGGVAIVSSGSLLRDLLAPDLVQRATEMVRDGRGMDLMPWGVRPGLAPSTVSAQVYASRDRLRQELYGDDSLPPALSKIALPMLAVFGDHEGRAKGETRKFLDSIRRNAIRSPAVSTHILRGATYLYTGFEAKLAHLLSGWIDMLETTGGKPTVHDEPE